MKRVAKVAVSLPVDTLRALERARTRLRKTRSAAVTEAVEKWLHEGEVGEQDRLYVEGYLRQPEQPSGLTAVAAAVVEAWEPWE
jgi:metal-responsive CopG/Arc/MetJ family transcriptional regulator